MIVESYEDVIVLSGSLRSNFWETIHTAISLTLKRHPTGVIIDCSGLTDATAPGAETFRDAMEFIHRQDARVIVAAVPEPVLDVLRSVPEVRSQLAVSESVEAARRSLDLLIPSAGGKKQKIATPERATPILVCLTGNGGDRTALELASQIGDSLPSQVHMLYVVVVPRELPLQSPLPEQEERAAAALRRGADMLTEKQLAHTPHLERGRDIASTIHEMLKELPASHVVVPLSGDPQELENTKKLVGSVLGKVATEVIFVRAPG